MIDESSKSDRFDPERQQEGHHTYIYLFKYQKSDNRLYNDECG